ncbi:MAG: hypothetical protein ACRC10_07955 [Thermoguttaceae bacterium]
MQEHDFPVADPLLPKTDIIRFRCTRCMHPLRIAASMAETRVRCPYCFFDVVVPLQSTRETVCEAELYTVNAKPVDVEELDHLQPIGSFHCPICRTNLAVFKEEEKGQAMNCPECEAEIFVPELLTPNPKHSSGHLADTKMEGFGKSIEVYGLSDVNSDENDDNTEDDDLDDEVGLDWALSVDLNGIGSLDKQEKQEKIGSKRQKSGENAQERGPQKVKKEVPIWKRRDQFPVYCSLCSTMMWADDSQIGQMLTCPDCNRETRVIRPEKPQKREPSAVSFEGATYFGTKDAENDKDIAETENIEGTGNIAQTGNIEATEDIEATEHIQAVENIDLTAKRQRAGKEQGDKKRGGTNQERLIPVVCRVCETRMYAKESEIGQFKVCPDCETPNEVKAVREEERFTPEPVGSEYDLSAPSVVSAAKINYGVDYRTVGGSVHHADFRDSGPIRDDLLFPDLAREEYRKSVSLAVPLAESQKGQQTGDQSVLESNESTRKVASSFTLEGIVRDRKRNKGHIDALVGTGKARSRRHKDGSPLTAREVAAILYPKNELPRHPFLHHFFRPLGTSPFRMNLVLSILLCIFPVIIFSMLAPSPGSGPSVVLAASLFPLGVASVFLVVWIALVAQMSETYFGATANGDDTLELELGFSLFGGLVIAVKTFAYGILAVMPGYVVWTLSNLAIQTVGGGDLFFEEVFLPIVPTVLTSTGLVEGKVVETLFLACVITSLWIFYPVIFLSFADQSVSHLPVSTNILGSWFRIPRSWLVFYFLASPFALALGGLAFLIAENGLFPANESITFYIWSGICLYGITTRIVYYRLLGRLAWIIEVDSQEREEDDNV